MKIIARETRPYGERLVDDDIKDRPTGEALICILNANPRLKLLGVEYRLVEDDYKLLDRNELRN